MRCLLRKFVSITILTLLTVGVCFAEEIIIRVTDTFAPPAGETKGTYHIAGSHDPKTKQLVGQLYVWDDVKGAWKLPPLPAPIENKDAGVNTWRTSGQQVPGKYKIEVIMPSGTPIPSVIKSKEFTIPAVPPPPKE